MTRLLEASGVYFSYPSISVLKDVALDVVSGESHVVIGPNGAGKTTLFKVLSGESAPNAGVIRYQGVDITRMDAWQRVRRGFGRTFQVARIFPELSVLENLVIAGECRQRTMGERPRLWWRASPGTDILDDARQSLAEFGLAEKASQVAQTLAHGDKKRLELALCLALRPHLLMLDEPTAGMSREDSRTIVQLIQRLQAAHDLTLLLTEHDMEVVFGLATRLTVLSQGEVIASGLPDDVRNDATVQKVYLGQGDGHA